MRNQELILIMMSLGKARQAETCMALNSPTGTAQPAQQPLRTLRTVCITELSKAGLISW